VSPYFCVFTSCIIKIRLCLPSPLPHPPDLGLFPELRHLQRKSGLTCDVSRTTTRTIPFPRGGGERGEGEGEGILTVQCRRYYSTPQNLCIFSLQMDPASKGGHEKKFLVHKSANYWAHSSIATQISEVCQSENRNSAHL
jgi:hypothetical protein